VGCGAAWQGKRCWSCAVVALPVFDSERVEGVEFGLRFDAFREEDSADFVAEGHERGDERASYRVDVDAAGEAEVEFDDVGSQVEDVAQAREAGAGIVDGAADAGRAVTVERLVECSVVVDVGVFGDFDNASGCGAVGDVRRTGGT
jgi:hypothetical protein